MTGHSIWEGEKKTEIGSVSTGGTFNMETHGKE